MKKKNKIILAILLWILIIPTATWAIWGIFSGFRTTSTNQIIDVHGVCKWIKNTWSKNYFVPTKTSIEWSTFLTNKPSDVAETSCSINGICNSAYTYSCSSGIFDSNPWDTAAEWRWSCLGQGGWYSSTHCTKLKPADGVCGNFSCTAGSLISGKYIAAGSFTLTWTCVGVGGGQNDYCSQNITTTRNCGSRLHGENWCSWGRSYSCVDGKQGSINCNYGCNGALVCNTSSAGSGTASCGSRPNGAHWPSGTQSVNACSNGATYSIYCNYKNYASRGGGAWTICSNHPYYYLN